MNAAHLHLALNHVPVVGIILGLALLVYALYAGNSQVLRATWAVFVVCALLALVVYFSGEGAEEIIEARPGFSEALVEAHEEAGLIALLSVLVLGTLSGLGLIFGRKETSNGYTKAVLVAALLVSGIMIWTASLGGQISHPEIRSTTVVSSQPADPGLSDTAERADDD